MLKNQLLAHHKRMTVMANNKGFTLIEMCLVLFIFSTILIVSTTIVLKQKELLIYEPFEQELELLVFEGYSLTQNGGYTLIKCYPERVELTRGYIQGVIREIDVPSSLTFGCSFKGDYLEFRQVNSTNSSSSGVNVTSGTMFLNADKRQALRTYTINFTYGRMKKNE